MNTNTDEHLAKLKQQCEQGLVTQEVYDRKQLQILDEEDSKGNAAGGTAFPYRF